MHSTGLRDCLLSAGVALLIETRAASVDISAAEGPPARVVALSGGRPRVRGGQLGVLMADRTLALGYEFLQRGRTERTL